MTKKKFVLDTSISTSYVPGWTHVEAFRELFQNAIDAETLDPSCKMSFKYHSMPQCVSIETEGAGLDLASLLLGSTTKSDKAAAIGQHGEGYKIALMVLLREGKTVLIDNPMYKQLWRPYIKKSRKFGGVDILSIEVADKELYNLSPNLTIEVYGITQEEWDAVTTSNLHIDKPEDVEPVPGMGSILLDEAYAGRVYVNGLYISTMTNFKYGYDIVPNLLKIDRDRRLVGTFDLAYETSKMWKLAYTERFVTGLSEHAEKGVAAVNALIDSGAVDVTYIGCRPVPANNTLALDVTKSFVATHGEHARPVTQQSEAEVVTAAGLKPVIVSTVVNELLQSVSTFEKIKVQTPVELLRDWFDRIESKLSADEKTEFEDIYNKL